MPENVQRGRFKILAITHPEASLEWALVESGCLEYWASAHWYKCTKYHLIINIANDNKPFFS